MLKITGTMMLVLMLTTLTASAAWAPLTVDESDQSTTAADYLTAETTWNGNGLRYVDYHNNNMTYDLPDTSVAGMMWLSEVGDVTEQWVAYEFTNAVKVKELTVWNYNDVSQLAASIQEFRVLYTTDTTSPLKDRSWENAGTATLARGTGNNYYLPNTTIDTALLDGLNDRAITGLMLEVISTYGSSQAGLSEIHFEGEVVPEPATMGLLAVGGLAMLRSRRRRNNK